MVLINEKLVNDGCVKAAVSNTFERRKTDLPDSCPIGLSDEFAHDPTKIVQWRAFLKKSGLSAGELSHIIVAIREYLHRTVGLRWQSGVEDNPKEQ